jgi:hypothetical protein
MPTTLLWDSLDGTNWGRVVTTTGEWIQAYEIGMGPLGLAVIGSPASESGTARPLYLSVDGALWEPTGSLTFFDPSGEWHPSTPVVGTDTIIVPAHSYGDNDNRFSLLIGRLLP